LTALSVEFCVLFLERIRDVFEENETQYDVFIFRGVHAAAQRIGHPPQIGFIADVGRRIRVLLHFWHHLPLEREYWNAYLNQAARVLQGAARLGQKNRGDRNSTLIALMALRRPYIDRVQQEIAASAVRRRKRRTCARTQHGPGCSILSMMSSPS